MVNVSALVFTQSDLTPDQCSLNIGADEKTNRYWSFSWQTKGFHEKPVANE